MLHYLEPRCLLSTDCSFSEDETEFHYDVSQSLWAPIYRMKDVALGFGAGLLRAIPAAIITAAPAFVIGLIGNKLPELPLVSKPGPFFAFITAFALYPLSHETIEILANKDECKDPDFCEGYLQAVLGGYAGSLDSFAKTLSSKNYSKKLPFFDPGRVYESTASAASILYTVATSRIFPDSTWKLGAPHLEMESKEETAS